MGVVPVRLPDMCPAVCPAEVGRRMRSSATLRGKVAERGRWMARERVLGRGTGWGLKVRDRDRLAAAVREAQQELRPTLLPLISLRVKSYLLPEAEAAENSG